MDEETSFLKRLTKAFVNAIALTVMLLPALFSGFGRFPTVFTFFAQTCALLPGLPGDFLRVAYYHLTLESCSLDSRISFGTVFAHPSSRVGSHVYVGAYCVLGHVRIGRHTHLSSQVQVLSGSNQHPRDQAGRLLGSEEGAFRTVTIGEHSWIGAGAIVMHDIGDRVTVGAGSIVTTEIPFDSTAVGNPARVIRHTA